MEIDVPCARCGTTVRLAQQTIDHVMAFGRILHKRGEPTLRKDEVALCDKCYPQWREDQAEETRRKERQVDEVCRKLKAREAASVPKWMLDGGEWEQRISAARSGQSNARDGND